MLSSRFPPKPVVSVSFPSDATRVPPHPDTIAHEAQLSTPRPSVDDGAFSFADNPPLVRHQHLLPAPTSSRAAKIPAGPVPTMMASYMSRTSPYVGFRPNPRRPACGGRRVRTSMRSGLRMKAGSERSSSITRGVATGPDDLEEVRVGVPEFAPVPLARPDLVSRPRSRMRRMISSNGQCEARREGPA